MLKNPINSSLRLLLSKLNPKDLQFIRWARKPRHLPMAKSKMFKVHPRKRQPSDEYQELLRLHNIYRTQFKSVMAYFREEAVRRKEISTEGKLYISPEQEEENFQRSLRENDLWGLKSREEREKRLAREENLRFEEILGKKDKSIIREEEERLRIDEIVRKEKERFQGFIPREEFDKTIEYALANPVDYNFAIDLKGNIYRGRETTPKNVKQIENTFLQSKSLK